MLFILIPGLILVALMIYASTRVKKIAAAAYDAETIETDEFVIQKPEGFLHNLNGDPKYIFEAYSKEYSKANDKLRFGTATVARITDRTVDEIISALLKKEGVVDDSPQVLDGLKYYELTQHGPETEVSYKLAEKSGNVYQLEITALDESKNGQWVETFFDSFRVK